MTKCVHCKQTVSPDDRVCPHCGGEQPAEWMVKVVYVLSFLFVQGVVYRLLWPTTESVFRYAVYFALTGGCALAAWIYYLRKTQSSQ